MGVGALVRNDDADFEPFSNKAVGIRLRNLRVAHGYTQTYIADLLGLAGHTAVVAYENGTSGIPADKAAKLVELYEVTFDYLFGGDESGLAPHVRRQVNFYRRLKD